MSSAAMAGINLGLARMERLMPVQPWKAIHVAGTNGKGSICHYITAMLRANRPDLTVGQFTSPHLVWPGDTIQVNGRPISRDALTSIRDSLRLDSSVTSFEALALTAFEYFRRSSVDIGVIEVGLGGRLDATNVISNKLVTAIAKIGLDHQKFLGDTVEKIALEKAGVMVKGVPAVVDGSNSPGVLQVLADHAHKTGAPLMTTTDRSSLIGELAEEADLEPHQRENMACAILAYQIAMQSSEATSELISILKRVHIPGRLYGMDMSSMFPQRKGPVLLDGAHNQQSAEALAHYVNARLRVADDPVTWIISVSQSEGRSPAELLRPLLKSHDKLAAVEFGDVEGMPWVKPVDHAVLRQAAMELGVASENIFAGNPSYEAALPWAVEQARDRPIVAAGSLYGVQAILQKFKT